MGQHLKLTWQPDGFTNPSGCRRPHNYQSCLIDRLIDEPIIRWLIDSLRITRVPARVTKLHWRRMEGFVERREAGEVER